MGKQKKKQDHGTLLPSNGGEANIGKPKPYDGSDIPKEPRRLPMYGGMTIDELTEGYEALAHKFGAEYVSDGWSGAAVIQLWTDDIEKGLEFVSEVQAYSQEREARIALSGDLNVQAGMGKEASHRIMFKVPGKLDEGLVKIN